MSSLLSTSSGDLIADRRFNLAAALAADGDHAAAADVLEQALKRAPAWAEGWLTLGEWRQRLGNGQAAIAAYERAAAHNLAGNPTRNDADDNEDDHRHDWAPLP